VQSPTPDSNRSRCGLNPPPAPQRCGQSACASRAHCRVRNASLNSARGSGILRTSVRQAASRPLLSSIFFASTKIRRSDLGGGLPRAFGPGLRPGPRRQARWGGRGSGVNGAPEARPRGARMRSTVDAGGAAPDNARHSGLVAVTFSRRFGAPGAGVTAGPAFAGAAPGDVTAGTARGRYRGRRARQPPRPQGFRPKDAAKLPPRDGESPGYLSRLRPVTPGRSALPGCSHPRA
jgi:hypothetical protein